MSDPIVLVSMPFVSILRPSLALGALKACLNQAGLPCRVEHACLAFAHEVGIKNYAVGNVFPATLFLGEWIFAGAVFPDFHPDHDGFLNSLNPARGVFVSTSEELRAVAWELRRQAPLFVERLAQELVREGARIVGCTSTFQQNLGSLALLKRVKELDPTITTVMGGANCEAQMGRALLDHFVYLDYVVSGEAEELVGDFFRDLLEGRPSLPYGVMSQRQARPAVAPRATVKDMRGVPVPDFDDYFRQMDRLGLRDSLFPALPVETSRGCWWGQKHHCTFCGLNGQGMNFRSKTPEQALHQFRSLAERYGVRSFLVADNIIDVGYFKSVLPALAEDRPGYDIFYETKANLTRAQIEILARSGVRCIQPGLESISDSLLGLMDKGTTGLQNIQTLKWCREMGVHVTWLMLFCFPHDQLEWYQEIADQLPLLVHLQPPERLIRVGYHRFSPYFEKAEHYGLAPVPEKGYGYVYPFPPGELAYFFVDPGGQDRIDAILAILGEGTQNWMDRFRRDRPLLTIDDDGSTVRLLDTRFSNWPRRYEFQGAARRLLLECETIRSRAKLLPLLLEEGLVADEAEFEQVLDSLLEPGLLLGRGPHLLSLAVQGEIPPLPQGIPLGRLKFEAWPDKVTV